MRHRNLRRSGVILLLFALTSAVAYAGGEAEAGGGVGGGQSGSMSVDPTATFTILKGGIGTSWLGGSQWGDYIAYREGVDSESVSIARTAYDFGLDTRLGVANGGLPTLVGRVSTGLSFHGGGIEDSTTTWYVDYTSLQSGGGIEYVFPIGQQAVSASLLALMELHLFGTRYFEVLDDPTSSDSTGLFLVDDMGIGIAFPLSVQYEFHTSPTTAVSAWARYDVFGAGLLNFLYPYINSPGSSAFEFGDSNGDLFFSSLTNNRLMIGVSVMFRQQPASGTVPLDESGQPIPPSSPPRGEVPR